MPALPRWPVRAAERGSSAGRARADRLREPGRAQGRGWSGRGGAMTNQEAAPLSIGEKGVRLAVWTVLYLLPLGVALLPLFDEDIWWHLRAGQWIFEHGTL